MRGLVHVYTGDGKGKTTAAFGLAMRCRGRGGRVLIAQFLKSVKTGEAISAEKLGIEVICNAKPRGFVWEMDENERRELSENTLETLRECERRARDVDLLVLDEVINAVFSKILDEGELLRFLEARPHGVEVVLTGRGAGEAVIGAADYVSRIENVKHPFEKGVAARCGIEF